jgi:galactofuranosylgalactofuranosylrhamnosyl-N-acetylglucosaminyl-diphospho-decaprenol beta-1,5/1,6-galactofuranosyltransferase
MANDSITSRWRSGQFFRRAGLRADRDPTISETPQRARAFRKMPTRELTSPPSGFDSLREIRRIAAAKSDAVCLQKVMFPMRGRPTSLYLESNSSDVAFDTEVNPHLRCAVGQSLSFNSYFNTFFPSNWRKFTSVDEVGLRIRYSGKAALQVFSVGPKLVKTLLLDIELNGQDMTDLRWLTNIRNTKPAAAAIYFTLYALDSFELRSAEFVTRNAKPNTIRLSMGLCAFNRETQLAATVAEIRALRRDLPELVDIIIVNQGDKFTSPDLRANLRALGAREIAQDNLGGCGGFNRTMLEAISLTSRPTHHLVIDDDIILDARVIRKTIDFLKFATADICIGGQMLIIQDPEMLHEAGGKVPDFLAVQPVGKGRNMAAERSLAHFHAASDVDYNAWWYCAIPVAAIRKVGLSLPLFIHGDDIEYGVRLKAHGVETVVLPGVAVWHDCFTHKVRDWLRYYDVRNALINHSVHPDVAPQQTAIDVLGEMFQLILAHRYTEARIVARAYRDFLSGPDALFKRESCTIHAELLDFVHRTPASGQIYDGEVGSLLSGRAGNPVKRRGQLLWLFLMRFEQITIPGLRRRSIVYFDNPRVHPQFCGQGPYVVPTDPTCSEYRIYRPRRLVLWRRSIEALGVAFAMARKGKRATREWRDGFEKYSSVTYWQWITAERPPHD